MSLMTPPSSACPVGLWAVGCELWAVGCEGCVVLL